MICIPKDIYDFSRYSFTGIEIWCMISAIKNKLEFILQQKASETHFIQHKHVHDGFEVHPPTTQRQSVTLTTHPA
jgi:hypothetical protein